MKITDTKDIAKLEKLRKATKTNKAGGATFADMLAEASSSDEAAAPSSVHDITAINPQLLQELTDLVPKDGQARGHYMLDLLNELQHDILAGEGTAATQKLKVALEQRAIDYDALPEKLKSILDEIDLRAQLEVAKLESGQ